MAVQRAELDLKNVAESVTTWKQVQGEETQLLDADFYLLSRRNHLLWDNYFGVVCQVEPVNEGG